MDGSHGFPVHRPANNTSVQTPPSTICAPNAVHTATPEFLCPFIFPISIFFGKLSDDQFAIANCPSTANAPAITVATNIDVPGQPTRHVSSAKDTANSKPTRPMRNRFFPNKTSRKRTGAMKYVWMPLPSYANELYAGDNKIRIKYAIIPGKNRLGFSECCFNTDPGPNWKLKKTTMIGGNSRVRKANPLRVR